MEDSISEAIERRRVLAFSYDGHPRIVQPHALVREGQLRRLVLHAWQADGGSKSGELPGWRNFDLGGITGLEVLDETFPGPRRDFNPRRFRNVILSL